MAADTNRDNPQGQASSKAAFYSLPRATLIIQAQASKENIKHILDGGTRDYVTLRDEMERYIRFLSAADYLGEAG